MASDEEKPPISSSQFSINGQYLDESRSTITHQIKDEVPSGEKPGSAEKNLGSNVVKIAETVEDPFAHLPPDEQTILKAQVETPVVKSGVKTLYRYGTMKDFLILAVSAVCAIASGAALPLMSIVFSSLASQFNEYFQGTISRDTFDHILTHRVLYFVYLSVGEFFTVYISTIGFIYTGDHITGKIRAHYLEACMRQNIAFFDKLGSGEITTRIIADTNLVQDGISEKLGLILNAIGTFVTAFTIGFIKSWKLTLILSSSVVANTIAMGAGSRFIIKHSKQSLELHALGGSIAEEVISSIRNATAFGTQDKLARQYDRFLAEGEKSGYKVKFALGVMVGAMYLLINLNYGLAFWMGSRFLVDNEIDLTSIISILMSIMMGALALGNVAPNFQAFTTAIAAATKIFNTVDRVSPLDATSHKGIKLENIEGILELRNIKHIYPSRPEVTIMNGVSLTIPAGKMTALVGPSGSGKSTIIGLVERFYNPVGGQILLDGHDISSLNLGWLRQQISLVSQEPTLFNTTIFQNIAHGLTGTKWQNEKEETKRELIISAAKIANAHGFISTLPNGYQTNVGERGFLLSGGQKQRIAIARAVVSDPKILLLDEATSALDTKSEGVVQAALEVAAMGRTTITIAHRLSTVKDADNIVVLNEGRIVEQGTHDQLLSKQGAYYSLVEAQKISILEEQEMLDDENELIRQGTGTSTAGRYKGDPDDAKMALRLRAEAEKSQTSIALQNRVSQEGQPTSLWTLVKLVASFNRPEWVFMIVGLAFSIICGGGNPTQSIFFAKEITSLTTPLVNSSTQQPIQGAVHVLRHDVDFWSAMYLMLALIQLFAYCTQGIAFALCSEKLIRRVRDRAFRTILRQDISYFDREENTPGALTSFLSTQTTHVALLSGLTLGTILSVSATLIGAIVLSIAIAWKIALVCISTIPVLLGYGFFRFYLQAQFQQRAKKAYEKSASYACEATGAIRTVASLTREEDVLEHYRIALNSQARSSLYEALKSSLLYAASQSLIFLVAALGFWYGGQRIASHEYTLFQFFVCYMSIVSGAQSAGTIFSFAPDMGKAKNAAQELKNLFDLKPAIDTWSTEGDCVESIEGTIEFRDVHFYYPTRPEQSVLRGLNMLVKPGQHIALVGASGCGKSTTIALLERFYDPVAGGIFLDGKEISSLNVNEYRSFIALVSQEPTLYQGTIRENVLLGVDRDDISDSEIEFACREANIYEFITSLPAGFNTILGNKGILLSGGQKQRVAIARALLRDPKILLLDEATSALDSESEHVVQIALDKAAKGRTTIAVAHRLSTIQKADVIYVFDHGVIVESGDHTELMKKGGRYSELVGLQSLGKSQEATGGHE